MSEIKRVRLYVNGKRKKDIHPENTAREIFKYRLHKFGQMVIRTAFIGFAAYTIFTMGQGRSTVLGTVAEADGFVKVIDKTVPPILQKICRAESPKGHYNANGTVVTYVNNNKTVDVGKCQINEFYWGAKAVELGYNIYEEQGNEDMALWIFENYGTDPWNSSKSRWK